MTMKIDFDKIKDLHIICIGDIMLDEFIYGGVDRISPEAPIQVLKINKNNEMLGGVGNVVANLLELGAKVTLFSQVGKDLNGNRIAKLLDQYPTLEAYLYVDKDYTTVTKTRFLTGKHHLLRVDQEEIKELKPEIEKQVIETLKEVASGANVLIISDYNKGFISNNIRESFGELQILKIMDSKSVLDHHNHGKIDVITPNIKELEKYAECKITDLESAKKAIDSFNLVYEINNILLTAGSNGMHFFSKIGAEAENTPIWEIYSEQAYNNNPVDVSGAGDTVIAALAIGMGLNGYEHIQDTIKFASHCAAIAVSKSGTSTVSLQEIKNVYNLIPTDYRNYANAIAKIRMQQSMNKTIGFINGAFDMFHSGHVALLKKAKEKCDYLIVAVNSDESIKRLKGESRPIINEQDRCDVLRSNKHIDDVVIFDDDEPTNIIRLINPHVVFKGADYKDKELIEQPVLDEIKCAVEYLDTIVTHTSETINRIKNQ